MHEFELINTYFKERTQSRSDVVLGIGDDAALVSIPPDHLLAISTDTLIADVHFPAQTSPYDIGYKALAVNLSDMAAMGAKPTWMTLALSIPSADEVWLNAFSAGLFALANPYEIQLIGGDTTRSSLSITISIYGHTTQTTALRRDGAKPGDKICVSGTLGDAGLGLASIQNKLSLPPADNELALRALNQPTPRIELGLALKSIATSAIDISDGLLADLQHILDASQAGALINTDTLPLSELLKRNLKTAEATQLALSAGDDYELCFTIPIDKIPQLTEIEKQLNIKLTCIGDITATQTLQLNGMNHTSTSKTGFRHF